MRKKNITARKLLSLCLVLVFVLELMPLQVFAATAPEHEHVCSNRSIDQPVPCSAGRWSGYCDICGEPMYGSVPAGSHSWTGYTVTVQPGCTSSGTAQEHCAYCSEIRTSPVAAKGHSWGGEVQIQAPNCTQTGLSRRTCSVCGATDDHSLPALQHDFSMQQIEGTCTEPGKNVYTCDRCGYVTTRPGEIKGHSWSSWTDIVHPTYNKEGLAVRTCETCGETEEMTALPIVIPNYVRSIPAENETDTGIEISMVVANAPMEILEDGETHPGFCSGETMVFDITVTNTNDFDASGIVLYHSLMGEAPLAHMSLGAGASDSVSVHFTPKADDHYDGIVTAEAHAMWEEEQIEIHSNVIKVRYLPFPALAEVSITKEVINTPVSGSFQEDDVIEYLIRVTNISDHDVPVQDVQDVLSHSGGDSFSQESLASSCILAPGEILELTYSYMVTNSDVLSGSVMNDAVVTYQNEDGELVELWTSDTAISSITDSSTLLPIVTVSILNPPMNGSYYEVGETIHYQYSVRNPGGMDTNNCMLYQMINAIDPSFDTEVSSTFSLEPHQSGSWSYAHTVTEEDVAFVVIECQLSLIGETADGTSYILFSNVAVAPVYEEDYGETEIENDDSEQVTEFEYDPSKYTGDFGGKFTYETGHPAVEGGPYTGDYSDSGFKWGMPVLTLTEVSLPEYSDGYIENEIVYYELEVANTGVAAFSNCVVYLDVEGTILEGTTIPVLQENDCQTVSFAYTVTEQDCIKGVVAAVGSMDFQNKAGAGLSIGSNLVTVQTYDPVYLIEVMPVVDQSLVSGPPVNGFAQVNDTITYSNLIANQGLKALTDCKVQFIYEGALSMATTVMDSFDMEPGYSYTWTNDHTITADDVKTGYVTKTVRLTGTDYTGNSFEINSYPITVLAGELSNGFPTIDIAITSSPANGLYYTEGEEIDYVYTVQNMTVSDFSDCKVYSNIQSYNSSSNMVANGFLLSSGTFATYYDSHIVNADDITAGHVGNFARLIFMAPDGWCYDTDSEYVQVNTGEDGGAYIEKFARNTPSDGIAYQENEEIHFAAKVLNTTGQTLFTTLFTDPLLGLGGYVETSEIADGQYYEIDLGTYVVNAADVSSGMVVNTVYMTYYLEEADGSKSSNEVSSTMYAMTHGGEIKANLTKTEISSPANGKYYTYGEVIEYQITLSVAPDSAGPLNGIEFYDILEGATPIWYKQTLNPGESESCSYQYTVTKEDVARTYVKNSAYVIESGNRIDSNAVFSRTGELTYNENWDEVESKQPGTMLTSEDDTACRRVLSPLGDGHISYRLENCSVHTDIDEMCLELIEDAENDTELIQALNMSEDLWTEAIEELFAELEDTVEDASTRAVLGNAQVMFFKQMESYAAVLEQLYAESPVRAAELKVMELKKFCTDLCALVHDASNCTETALEAVSEDFELDGCGVMSCAEEAGISDMNLAFCPIHAGSAQKVIQLLNDSSDAKNTWEKTLRAWRTGYKGIMSDLTKQAAGEEKNLYIEDIGNYGTWIEVWTALMELVYEDSDLCTQLAIRAYMDRTTALCEAAS